MAGNLMGGIVPFFPEIKAPPIKAEPVLQVGPVVFTNSMLGALLAFVIVVLLIRLMTRRLDERPGKLQTAVEMLVGGLYNFAKGSGGSTGAALFPLFAGLLVWLLVNNWLALIPGFGQILVNGPDGSFPLLRAANADFNNSLALALMVFVLFHTFGVCNHGIAYSADSINTPPLPKGHPLHSSLASFH